MINPYRYSTLAPAAAGLALVMLGACGGTAVIDPVGSENISAAKAQHAGGPAASQAAAMEGRWHIVAFDGQAPAAASGKDDRRGPSIAFTPTGYGATAGCNALGGIGAWHGVRYYTMPGPQTLIGCMGRLAEQEKMLDAVMRASPTITTLASGNAQLAGGGHRLTLRRDSGAASPPEEIAPLLAGTRFQIMSVDGVYLAPRSQSDSRPLVFDAAGWRAKPVCGTISGSFRQSAWTLETGDIAVAMDGCAASGAGAPVDAAVRALFASRPRFSSGPNGELLLAGGGHWIAAERDTAALARDMPRLAGSWDIVRLDGRVPASEAPNILPRLDFGATSYSGSTGCNSISGNFLARAGRLYTSPGAATEKGCGSLTGQENRIYALLREAPRIGRAGNDIELVDAAGSMTIRRTDRAAQRSQAARPLPARYAGTALVLNGAPTQNRVTDPASRVTIEGNKVKIDIGCGLVSAVVRRDREGMSLISDASSSDGRACTGVRLTQHDLVMRLVNGPVAGIVDINGDLLLAGEGVWLTARTD